MGGSVKGEQQKQAEAKGKEEEAKEPEVKCVPNKLAKLVAYTSDSEHSD